MCNDNHSLIVLLQIPSRSLYHLQYRNHWHFARYRTSMRKSLDSSPLIFLKYWIGWIHRWIYKKIQHIWWYLALNRSIKMDRHVREEKDFSCYSASFTDAIVARSIQNSVCPRSVPRGSAYILIRLWMELNLKIDAFNQDAFSKIPTNGRDSHLHFHYFQNTHRHCR